MVRKLGQMRMIVFSQITTVIESIINFAVNMPINKYLLILTGPLSIFTQMFSDAIFL